MTVKQYPPDEFDELAEKRTLRGSHRRRRHWLTKAGPLIAALIIGPAAGWGVVELMSQDGIANPFITDEADETPDAPTDEPTDEVTEDVTEDPTEDITEDVTEDATDDVTEDPTDEPTEDPIETLPPVPGVTYDASINLYNGTGIPTGTDPAESSLLIAGYTEIDGGDYSSATPAQNAIYFANPELYATAQNIAQTLNIDFWAQNAAMTGDADIVIIIR